MTVEERLTTTYELKGSEKVAEDSLSTAIELGGIEKVAEEKLTTEYSLKGAEKVAEEKLTTEYSAEWVLYEELPFTEQTFKTTIVNEIISLEDSLPVADQVSQAKWTLNELLRLFEVKATAMQLVEGQYIEFVGKLFAPGSEIPVPGATIHVYDLNNRMNLPDLVTTTDEEGYFLMKLPLGDYILIATHQNYSLGWVYIKSEQLLEGAHVSIYVTPLNRNNCVERIFSRSGFMYKIYCYRKYDDPTKTKEIIEGVLVFGDLYNWVNPKATLSVDGTLEAITPESKIELIDLDYLGKKGFFDEGETIEEVGENVIYFTTTMRKGDFDGFAFKFTYPKGKLPLIRFKIGTDYVFNDRIPNDPPDEFWSGGSVGPYAWFGYYKCWGVFIRSWGEWFPSGEYLSPLDVCCSTTVNIGSTLFTKKEDLLMVDFKETLRLYEDPPTYPSYQHWKEVGEYRPFTLKDIIKLREGYLYVGYILLNDRIHLRERRIETPTAVALMGVVTDERGNPIGGAKVYVFYAGTDILVAETTTDEKGFYIVYVPSEKQYDIIITYPGMIFGRVLVAVGDKDLVDERCRAYLDSEGFVRVGDRWYYVAVLRLAEGGKIYGYVYNSKTLEPVPNVLVKAQTGQYENYGVSDENGYYEVYVPRGEWVVEARRPGFKPASGLKAVIQSNYRMDIYLDPATISGYVWDAVESSSTGIRKPIAGAKVRIGDSEATTDEKGYFTLETVEGEQEIVIEAPRYKTLKKKINVVTGGNYEFYLWKVSAYDDVGSGGRVTIKLVDGLNIKGG